MDVVLILGFIALCFVGASRFARSLIRRVSRADVLEQGVAGTALVRSMRETGTSVNDNPMPEWELDVNVPGRPMFTSTHQQVLPRLLLGQVRPGMTVPVKVAGTQVAIDFAALASGGDAAPGQVVDTAKFLETAIPARAEIDQMAETGRTVEVPSTGEERQVFSFVLTVHREGADPYQATLLQAVPPEQVGRIGPGASVPVGINPDDPGDVAVNWKALSEG